MVSIIEKSKYVSDLRKNAKFDLFFSLVFESKYINEFSFDAEVDKIFYNILSSIENNDSKCFNENYSQISAREPKKSSPFTNDDLLLFVLIIGAKKFSADYSWIQKTLDIRENFDTEGKLIKSTFQNIINNNYNNTDNAFQIVFIMENLLDIKITTWEIKKEFYKRISMLEFPFFKSDFLNILSFRAYDLIILQGDKSEDGLFSVLKEFERKFKLRVTWISRLTHFVLISFAIYIVFLLAMNPAYEKMMEKYAVILGIGGVTVLSIFKRENVIRWISVFFFKVFGYPYSKMKEYQQKDSPGNDPFPPKG